MVFIKKHLLRLQSFNEIDKNDFVLAVKKEVELFITSKESKQSKFFDKLNSHTNDNVENSFNHH